MKRVSIVPYEIGDLLDIDPQAAQQCEQGERFRERWQASSPPGLSWTFRARRRAGDVVIAVGGLAPLRGDAVVEAWSLIGKPTLAEWGELVALAREALDAYPARRIQAVAYADHPQGARTLERLGFTLEGVMRAFGPDGRDAMMFARVR